MIDVVAGIGHLIADTRAKTGGHIEGLRASLDIEYRLLQALKGKAPMDGTERVRAFSGLPFAIDPKLPAGTVIADLDPAM